MKALSLKNPWGSLVVQGKKTIETRKWNRKLDLPMTVYIHVSKQLEKDGAKEFGKGDLPQGYVVGKVTITGIKKYSTLKDFQKDKTKHLGSNKWYKPNSTYGYILKNPKKIKPFKYKGQLGFFEIIKN